MMFGRLIKLDYEGGGVLFEILSVTLSPRNMILCLNNYLSPSLLQHNASYPRTPRVCYSMFRAGLRSDRGSLFLCKWTDWCVCWL
jgi:hypothetical protein